MSRVPSKVAPHRLIAGDVDGFRFEYRRGCNFARICHRGIGIAVHAAMGAVQADPVNEFRTSIQPILTQYCFDCHADGVNKGRSRSISSNPMPTSPRTPSFGGRF